MAAYALLAMLSRHHLKKPVAEPGVKARRPPPGLNAAMAVTSYPLSSNEDG